MTSLPTGRLFVIAAPSGTGKTTICNQLQKSGAVSVCVSYTTRPLRGDERHGDSYFFIDYPTFLAMRENNCFLECAQVYGYWYGTTKKWVEKKLANNENVLLEIDCQGALQVKKKYPETITIFIRPPSLAKLEQRLRARQTDSLTVINRRLQAAKDEIAQEKLFDYVIINDDLRTAVNLCWQIIKSQL